MARVFGIFMILMSIGAVVAAQTTTSSVTITWLGQATFVMETSTGFKVLLDPTNPGAYNPAPVDGVEVITITHEHPDHNYIQMATGNPLVLRGLTQDDFAKVDQTIKGVHIRTVPAYHDIAKGAQRRRNALFIFEMQGLKIAHLGDLGHKLDPQQASAVGRVDILMTPVAGGPTMDSETALEVINQLQAKVVIPMHYFTPAMANRPARGGKNAPAGRPGVPSVSGEPRPAGPDPARTGMAGVEVFLNVLDPSIKVEQAGHEITLTTGKLPLQRTVMVMRYE